MATKELCVFYIHNNLAALTIKLRLCLHKTLFFLLIVMSLLSKMLALLKDFYVHYGSYKSQKWPY